MSEPYPAQPHSKGREGLVASELMFRVRSIYLTMPELDLTYMRVQLDLNLLRKVGWWPAEALREYRPEDEPREKKVSRRLAVERRALWMLW